MEPSSQRKRLTIKPVEVEHLNQYNELLRYVFQVTNKDLIESGYEDEEIIKAKRPILQAADVFGFFNEDDELVSQLCIYNCKVNIYGKVFEMGGLTGAGTYPEYANLGLMHELITLSLAKMRANKQYISYLYPYSIPFYRKKGWELMSDRIAFTLKDNQLPKHTDVSGYVERLDVTDADVLSVYEKFSMESHGAMIRGKFEWEEYWRWEIEDERTAAVYYNANDEPIGYVLYWIEEDTFYIKDFIYLNQEARKGLWNFISAHFSMIDTVKGYLYTGEPIAFLLEDSRIKESIEPYYMARIIDVEEFLKIFPFVGIAKPFHFVITDPIAEWNNGVFGVDCSNEGETIISREAIGSPVITDIQTLTALLFNYKSPSYLAKIERLKTDKATLRILRSIIPNEQVYFSDYF